MGIMRQSIKCVYLILSYSYTIYLAAVIAICLSSVSFFQSVLKLRSTQHMHTHIYSDFNSSQLCISSCLLRSLSVFVPPPDCVHLVPLSPFVTQLFA